MQQPDTLLLVLVSATDPPTVTVKNGSYYGAYQSNYNQDFFLGMPYAQPPVGDLRFRNPEPLNSTWSEAKNATEYSPECYGYGSDQWVLGNVISEDCLTINVVRPSGIAEGVKLPVGFWIHGGGLFEGGNRDPRYNFSVIIDEATAAGKPFIDVPVNQLSDILNSPVASSTPFYPVVDDDFIEKAGPTLMSEGKFVRVPILHGTNHDEGTAFGTAGIDTEDKFLAYVESVTESAEFAAILADLYPDIPEIVCTDKLVQAAQGVNFCVVEAGNKREDNGIGVRSTADMRFYLYPVAAAAAALLAALTTASDVPTVTVKNGSYYGVYQSTYDQDFFLGMPYAQPPVGDLRLRNPQSLNATWTEAKNATEYSPMCYGYGSDTWVLGNVVSEDCLTINVVRPSNVSEGSDLPVGVWIHGGGLTQGSGSDPRYNLSYIVEEAANAGQPFIGVSLNYRLQAFGFMSGTAVHNAGVTNLALKDQRLAMHWVQENIVAFGGNASKVTIWGESAGARSIGYQLIAYDGRDDGLFRSAVMESGASAYWPKSFKNASAWDANYNSITDAANCSSAEDTLDCLRKIPIDTLSAIFNSTVGTSAMYAPSVDGDFLTDVGPKLIGAGKFVHVPILHGANFDEGTSFGKTGINTTEEFASYLTGTMGYSDDEADILLDLYPDIPQIGIPATLHGRPGNDTSYGYMYKRVSAYAGDNNQHGPRRFMSQMWAKDNVPVYSYRFNVLTAGTSQYLGATHFTEVAFVFYNLAGNGYNNSVATDPFLNKPESYTQLARLMTRMWVSFIVDQTPNNNLTDVEWPQYSLDDPQNFVFDTNVTNVSYVEPDFFRTEAIAYIHSLYNATS
ncbi:hypothetical protein BBO99_00005858 [Phytophthora kernoviae]|uniref:Carboxylesterase type B domain-containing protein n=2 Tax=Phytophthora kernoviae TaxID=325452 RepID=A0A421GME4_9STRA|nr:hypothetical protein JM16_006105 [Phytophthora kernoviae]KAG2523089.1 hypothetical protein JM18_005894 [Phytophthora kernoviae]RLN31427.1 hypothetical protein BBI17_006374 [Phytophthora kernoviae]RLN78600.1 hypothetical protein BBO99_00005858 [Phytophthora kernoviae]